MKDITLRQKMGVSILTVSRAGYVHFDPGPDFLIYPGDRLMVIGSTRAIEDLKSRDLLQAAPQGATRNNAACS